MNRLVAFTLISLLGTSACQQFQSEAERRSKRASSNDGDIVIGVAWPFAAGEDGFREGIELARNEINQAGGVEGRMVNLVFKDDQNNIEAGKLVAQEFSENLDMIAVIGHQSPRVGQVASLIYEYSNIVMISPGNSSTALTRNGFKRVFRTLPGEGELGKYLAQKATEIDGEKILIVYQNNDFGRALANSFESKAEDLRLRIVMRLAFDRGAVRTFERSVKSLRNDEIDLIVLATNSESSLAALQLLKESGINKPVFTTLDVEKADFLNKPDLIQGVKIASVFDVDSTEATVQKFVASYLNTNDQAPTVWSAQAYDAMKVLHAALVQANSSQPEKIANALRGIKVWKGVTGPHSFDERGRVSGKPLFIKKFVGKKFVREVDVETSIGSGRP